MYSKTTYLLFILTGLFLTSCEKLATDPKASSDADVQTDSGINYWDAGNELDDFGYGVIQTTDGGYVVVGSSTSSSTQQDIYVVKFDNALVQDSNTPYTFVTYDVGGDADASNDIVNTFDNFANDIQQTPDGGFVLVGSTFNGTDYDAVIIKLNADFSQACLLYTSPSPRD